VISQAENVSRDAHYSYLGWSTAYHPHYTWHLYERTGASKAVSFRDAQCHWAFLLNWVKSFVS
jgi:hypothetical protein